MTITVSVPEGLAQRARAEGVSVEFFVERLLAQNAQRPEEPKWMRLGPGPLTPEQAVDDLREARRGATLGGLKIKTWCMRAISTDAGICADASVTLPSITLA